MEITEVRILPGDGQKVRAFVHITFDNCFTVRDLKIIQGPEGLFIAMPNRKRKDGTFENVAFPANAEMRKMIEERVIAEFKKVVGGSVTARALSVK